MRYLLIAACLAFAACGKFQVQHDVSGSVQLNVTVTPADFTTFFTADCAQRGVGQMCYNRDPKICAACMSQALFTTLSVPQ